MLTTSLNVLQKRLYGEEVGSEVSNEWSSEAKVVLEALNKLLLTSRFAHTSIQSSSPDAVAEELRRLDPDLAQRILGAIPQNAAAMNSSGAASATVFAVVTVLAAILSLDITGVVDLMVRCIQSKDCEDLIRHSITHNLSVVLSTPLSAQGKGTLPTAFLLGCVDLWLADQKKVYDALITLTEMGNYIVGYDSILEQNSADNDHQNCEEELVDLMNIQSDDDDDPESDKPLSSKVVDRPPMCSQTRLEILNLLSLLEARGLYRVVFQRLMSCFEFFKDESKIQATVNQALNNAELHIIQCGIQYRTANVVDLYKAFDQGPPPTGTTQATTSTPLSGTLFNAAAVSALSPTPQLIQLSLDPIVFETTATHRRYLMDSWLSLYASLATCLSLQNAMSFGALVCLTPHIFTLTPIDFPAEQQLVGPHAREYDIMVENFYSDIRPSLALYEVGIFIVLITSCLLDRQHLRIFRKAPSENVDIHVNPTKPLQDVEVGIQEKNPTKPLLLGSTHTITPATLFNEDSIEGKICRWFHDLPSAADPTSVNIFLRYVAIACHAPSTILHQSILRVLFAVQQKIQNAEGTDNSSRDTQSDTQLRPPLFLSVGLKKFDEQKSLRPPNYKDPHILTSRAMFLDSWLRRAPQRCVEALPMIEGVLAPGARESATLNITGHRQIDESRSLNVALAQLYVTAYVALESNLSLRSTFRERYAGQFNTLWVPVEQLALSTKRSPTSVALETLARGHDWRDVLASWAWGFRAVGVGAFPSRQTMTLKAALALLSVDFHGLAERFGDSLRREWLQGVCSCVVGALNVFNELTVSPGVDETGILRALGDRLGRIKALLWMITKEIEVAEKIGGLSLLEPAPVVLFESYILPQREVPNNNSTTLISELVNWKTLLMLAIVKSFIALKGHQANMHAADTLLYLKFIESQLLPDLSAAFERIDVSNQGATGVAGGTLQNTPAEMTTQMTNNQGMATNAMNQLINNSMPNTMTSRAETNEPTYTMPTVNSNLWKLATMVCHIIDNCLTSIPPRSGGGLAPAPGCSKPSPGAAYLATSMCSENSLWQKTLVVCCAHAFDTLGQASSVLPHVMIDGAIKAIYACITRDVAALALPRALHGEDSSPWGSWVNSSGYDLAPHLCPTGSGWGVKLCRYEREFLWSCPKDYDENEPANAGQAGRPTNSAPTGAPQAVVKDMRGTWKAPTVVLGRSPLVLDIIRWAAKNPLSHTTRSYIVPILCALITREPSRLAAIFQTHGEDARTLEYLFACLLSLPNNAYDPPVVRDPKVKEIELADSRLLLRTLASVRNNIDNWLFEQSSLESVIPDSLQSCIPAEPTTRSATPMVNPTNYNAGFVLPYEADSRNLILNPQLPPEGIEPLVVVLNDPPANRDGTTTATEPIRTLNLNTRPCNHPSQFPIRFIPPKVITAQRVSLVSALTPRQRILELLLACLEYVQRSQNLGHDVTPYPWLPHPIETILGLRPLAMCLSQKYLHSPEDASEVIEALSMLVQEDPFAIFDPKTAMTPSSRRKLAAFVDQSIKASEILALCIYHRTLVPVGAGPAAQFPLRKIVCRHVRIHSEDELEEPLLRSSFWLSKVQQVNRPLFIKWISGQARLAAAEVDAFLADNCRTCVECLTPSRCIVVADDDVRLWKRALGLRKFCRKLTTVVKTNEPPGCSLAILANFEASVPAVAEVCDVDVAKDRHLLLTYENVMGYLSFRTICSQLVCTTACLTLPAVLEKFTLQIAPVLTAYFSQQLQSLRSSTALNGFEFVALSSTRVAIHVGVIMHRYTEILHQMILEPGRLPSFQLTSRGEAKKMLELLTNCHRLVTSLSHNSELTQDYIRQALSLMLERAALLVVEIDKESVFRELNENSSSST